MHLLQGGRRPARLPAAVDERRPHALLEVRRPGHHAHHDAEVHLQHCAQAPPPGCPQRPQRHLLRQGRAPAAAKQRRPSAQGKQPSVQLKSSPMQQHAPERRYRISHPVNM